MDGNSITDGLNLKIFTGKNSYEMQYLHSLIFVVDIIYVSLISCTYESFLFLASGYFKCDHPSASTVWARSDWYKIGTTKFIIYCGRWNITIFLCYQIETLLLTFKLNIFIDVQYLAKWILNNLGMFYHLSRLLLNRKTWPRDKR